MVFYRSAYRDSTYSVRKQTAAVSRGPTPNCILVYVFRKWYGDYLKHTLSGSEKPVRYPLAGRASNSKDAGCNDDPRSRHPSIQCGNIFAVGNFKV